MPIFDPKPLATLAFSDQIVEARRFYLGPGSPSRNPSVIAGGCERVSHAYTISRRHVPFVGLELVVSGSGEANLNGASFPLQAGTLFTYGQSTPHSLTTSRDQPLTKYFLDVSGAVCVQVMKKLSLTIGTAWQVRNWIDLARFFESIIDHGVSSGRHQRAICDTLLHALLLQAAQSIVDVSQATAAYRSYQQCSALIDNAYLRFRSLEDLATEAKLAPAYICRLFKKFDTESPYRRLLRRRMSAAAARLHHGSTSVKAVALEFGYSDQFHFSRAFKSVTGVAPTGLAKA